MSFLKSVKKAIASGRDSVVTQVGRYKNKTFMQGVVAVCARVAVADGTVSAEEKQKMIGFLKSSAELKVFNTDEIIAFFTTLTNHFDFDVEVGKGETMKYILALKSEPEMAQLAIRVGVAIAKSDGSFDEDERLALKDVAQALGFSAADFDL